MRVLAVIFFIGNVLYATAQADIPIRTYATSHVGQSAPLIDGQLDDPAWNEVDWAGEFVQRQPVDGAEPSQETQFKILYDEKYLYVGIRAFDTEPDKVVRRMSRRDGF